jgi:hypothetical protein
MMRNVSIKKGVVIKLILVMVIFGLVACDSRQNNPKKIKFLNGSFAVIKPASWSLRNDLNDVADLQMGTLFKEAYVIIISENKMDFDNISLENHSDLTRALIKKSLKNYHESGPEYLNNGEFRTLRYQLTGIVNGINIVYWHVTIETKKYFHQILLWSLKSKFSKNEADFNAVIQSFEVINE